MWLVLPFLLQTIKIGCISPPEIVEHPGDVVVARNEPVTLNCKVTGSPEPSVEWFKDGESVTTARDDPRSHRILLPDNGLFFLRAQQSKKERDSGEYWCRATSSRGSVTSRRGHLQVAFLDKEFQGLPSDVDVSAGARVVIPCKAPKGFPRPSITWIKDGRLYALTEGRRLEGDSLVVSSVTEADVGRYQCRAENVAGARESPAITLGVHEAPYFIQRPAPVQVALVGGDLELVCRPGGDPQPRVSWTRRGQAGQLEPGKARMLEGGGLRLVNLHPSDEGEYECRAENRMGSTQASVRVIVQERPVLTVTPETRVQVRAGEELKLSCLATGRPSPAIFWGKEGALSVLFPGMSVANVHVTGDGCLKIRDPVSENSGRYTCSVVNEVGAAMAMSHVTIISTDNIGVNISQTSSDSPDLEGARMILHQQRILDLVSVTALGERSVELGWNFVGSRVYLDGVVIQFRQSSRRYDQLETITLSDNRATGHTIRNLEGGTEYDVFVQPFYRSVVGLPSSIKHIKTKTAQIVRKTEILVADMINVTTAFIVWQPKQPATGVTGYQVVLKNNRSSLSTTVDAGVSEVFLKLNPADMSDHYLVSVAPRSALGPGQFSAPVNLSLPDGLPISVQPNLAEVESTAWLVVLLGSLAFMFLLLSSVMFYYRRRKAASCGTSAGYLPAAVTDMEQYQAKTPGVLWSEGHWDTSEMESTASHKQLLQTSPSLATEYSYTDPGASGQCHLVTAIRSKPSFESPYATSNVIYDPERKIKVSATMHELQVTPLLMHKGSKSRHHQRLKRGSQSFDECGEDYRGRVTSHHKPSRAYKRQRSNPNILDLIPPPPPLCAPPSLPRPDYPPYDLDQRPGSSKPHRTAAFKIQHIKDRRDSDTSEYFTQGSSECPVHCGEWRPGEQMAEAVLRQELSNFNETVSHFSH